MSDARDVSVISMPVMSSQCFDCPWSEPGNREDMIDLLVVEPLWPCHHTATFDEDEYGCIENLVEEPRNRQCFGYVKWLEEARSTQ